MMQDNASVPTGCTGCLLQLNMAMNCYQTYHMKTYHMEPTVMTATS